ncbi:MAG: DNA polymerase III subunit gamma/tau [Candidatus Omnitrophica bacterium]|nr:DNA polymerase III subunit gamma/tau [Candidatus Omnitrophota bacterium]
MSYLVYARKYRPQIFDDVVGQTHITDILKKTVTSGHLAQAYLFCGPRGVGKTSCARILAKSLNCQNGPTLKPCGECPACSEIAKGVSFDVLEIDGASNRGIDEIRTLRENVKFAPNYGRYKIYIVDEVHMLTAEAFNALLKTLEEPPEYVKFIFATTEPNKVPATIISRCQRFDFKRVSIKDISAFLEATAQKEALQADPDALFAVAKAGQGSLRDALSILDQLSAHSERRIQSSDVFSMLGLVETDYRFTLVDAISRQDCAAALTVVDQIVDKGKDIKQLIKDMTEHFRDIMVIKIGGKTLEHLVEYPAAIKERYWNQAQHFTLAEILNAIDVLIAAQDTARITETLRMPLEISLAKLTYRETEKIKTALGDSTPVAKTAVKPQPEAKPAQPAPRVLSDKKGMVDISGKISSPETAVTDVKELQCDLPSLIKNWDQLTYAVSRIKMSVATYLQEAKPYELSGSRLTIALPGHCGFHKESLDTKDNLRLVEDVFQQILKQNINIKYVLVDVLPSAVEDASVASALDTFGGEVVEKWHAE